MRAHPAWPLVLAAAGIFAAALASLAWGIRRPARRPMLAGFAILGGVLLAPLAFLALLYGLNLSGNLGR